jgi:membrane protease YdiL (CAAX protease family)
MRQFMDKQKVSQQKNTFTVLDAFRFFFYLIIAIIVTSAVYSVVISLVENVTSRSLDDSEIVAVIEYLLSPFILIVFSLIYCKVRKLKLKNSFSDGQKISLLPISVAIVLAIIAIFLFTPFMEAIEYGFTRWGYNPDDSIPMEEKMKESGKFFFLGLFIYALLPAIAEEIVFRGVILNSLQSKYNGFVAITISTLLFVFTHGALQQTVYQLVMGIMLGYVACVGGSILYSIILHFLNNAFVLLFGCFEIVPYLSEGFLYYNIFSLVFPICIFLLGVVLVGILFWVLKYLRTKNFFRYDPRRKKKSKNKEQVVEEKLKFKDMWKNLQHNEKVYALAGVCLIGFIWLINTISEFMV